MRKDLTRADLYCLTMALVWGANVSIVKDAIEEIAPLSFNAVRMLLGAAVLWLLTLVMEGRIHLRRADVGKIILLGLIGNTLYQFIFIYGVKFTKAGNVAILLSSGSIMTALLSRFLGLEMLTRTVWLGILTSLFGVVLIILESAEFSFQSGTLAGDLMILFCTVCWSVYTVYSKPLMTDYSPLSLTALTLGFGSLALFFLSLPALTQQNWAAVPLLSYAELTYSFILAIGLGYGMWFYAISRLGSTRTAVYGNLIPFAGLLVAWWFLGESITPFQIGGGGLILTGIYLTRLGRPPDAPSGLRRRQV